MGIHFLTVQKECSHENKPLISLDCYCVLVLGASTGRCPFDNPLAGERTFPDHKRPDKARKIRYQAHTGSCATDSIGFESAAIFSDTCPIISYSSGTCCNRRTNAVRLGPTATCDHTTFYSRITDHLDDPDHQSTRRFSDGFRPPYFAYLVMDP
jgi:hypothetical protein